MLHRRIAWIIAGALVLPAVGAAPAQSRYSAKKAIWGPVTVNGASEFPRYQSLGVGIWEATLGWSVIAPTRPAHPRNPNDPAYHWPADISEGVVTAPRYGMKVALQLFDAPKWANGNRDGIWAPTRTRDFADFAYAAARRYPGVHLWMVWGEPTRNHNFRQLVPAPATASRLTSAQAAAPRRYARLLDAAYGELKRVSKRNRVIGGMSFTSGDITAWQWVRYMRLPNGKPPRLDLYGHNPFTWRTPNPRAPASCCGLSDFNDLPRLSVAVNRNLRRKGQAKIKLFLSEFMIPTAPDSELNVWVDPPVQAAWIRAVLRTVRRSSLIAALGWIHVRDEPPSSDGSPVVHSGLLYSDGTPKPGYSAFRDG